MPPSTTDGPEEVAPALVRPLRAEVLRPGLPETSTHFRGDDLPLACHLAAFGTGREVVAVGTIFPDPPPWDVDRPDAWRIRGMATTERCRGRGLGRGVLDGLVAHAVEHGATLVWCHARVGALAFYRRAGFDTVGDPFDDGIALHQSMQRVIA